MPGKSKIGGKGMPKKRPIGERMREAKDHLDKIRDEERLQVIQQRMRLRRPSKAPKRRR
jgi:hypothetical protein